MDCVLLDFHMKKNGYSISAMCEALDLSRSAFYRKCRGKSEFTQNEISKIISLLNLDAELVYLIFFTSKVS